MSEMVFVSVKARDMGELELEMKDDSVQTEKAIILTLEVMSIDSTEVEEMTLVIPQSGGYDLISNLLNDDQLDAALNA